MKLKKLRFPIPHQLEQHSNWRKKEQQWQKETEAKTTSSALLVATENTDWIPEALQARDWPEPLGARIPVTVYGNPPEHVPLQGC